MKSDRLFLCSGDTQSALLRQIVKRDKILDEDYRGTTGQQFNVLSAGSWSAFKELVEAFDLEDRQMPVLETSTKKKYYGSSDIEAYLLGQGLA